MFLDYIKQIAYNYIDTAGSKYLICKKIENQLNRGHNNIKLITIQFGFKEKRVRNII